MAIRGRVKKKVIHILVHTVAVLLSDYLALNLYEDWNTGQLDEL